MGANTPLSITARSYRSAGWIELPGKRQQILAFARLAGQRHRRAGRERARRWFSGSMTDLVLAGFSFDEEQ